MMRRVNEIISLKPRQRRALEKLVGKPSEAAGFVRRVRVVLLSDDGVAPSEIATRLSLSREGVSRIRRRFLQTGVKGLADQPKAGRKDHALAPELIDRIVNLAMSPPVYKVDRLSRSLLDFARIIEAFDQRKIAFVSVTQQFNTATSLGRLVLNILLSFAQFEREMIAERTRDKMSAARKKGKWIGGCPPLGYDVASGGGKLMVNAAEADQVRAIFDLYLQERSLLRCVEFLNGRGGRTKAWTTKEGRRREGSRWEKASLRKLLTNPVYVAKVSYRGAIYQGEHPGIVDAEAFTRVGEMLGEGRADRRRSGNKYGFLLRGLVRCTACGSAMTSATSTPRGKPYRYYCCTAPRRRGTGECPVRAVSAAELERFVVDRIRDVGRDPTFLQETLAAMDDQRREERPALEREQRTLQVEPKTCRDESRRLVSALAAAPSTSVAERLAELELRAGQIESRLTEIQGAIAALDRTVIAPEDVAVALAQFDPVWEALVPREQANLLQLLIERVDYDGVAKEVAITFRPSGIDSLAGQQRSAA
jgi:site-specific DNA recombinase